MGEVVTCSKGGGMEADLGWHHGKRPTEEDVSRLRERLRELEDRYRYTPDEGREAIAAVKEELAAIEDVVEKEAKRIAAVRAAKERERLKKEAEVEKARSKAREGLPELAQRVEAVAQAWAEAITSWAKEAAGGLSGVEELSDTLDALRQDFVAQARAAGEVVDRYGPQATPALRTLLESIQRSSSILRVDPEIVKRLAWAVEQVKVAGSRDPRLLHLPMGGPSYGKVEEMTRRGQQAYESAMRKSRQRREAMRLAKEAQAAKVAARVEEILPEIRARLARAGYSGRMLDYRAREIAAEQANMELKEVRDDA